MIGPIVIQDLITIDSAFATWRQPAPVGVAALQDIVVTADVRALTIPQGGTLTLFLDTAPDNDELLYVPMVTLGTTLAVGVATIKILLTQADVPVQRWVRCRIELTGAQPPWSGTLRVVASGNPSGGR